MVFKPKRDIWMGMIIWTVIGIFFYLSYKAVMDVSIFNLIFELSCICFLGAIWFNTHYRIEGELIVIRFGFIKKTIQIKEITSIRKTTNLFTAPSLSIRRLEINYGKYKTVQISPKNDDLFIKQLKKIHSKIEWIN